MTNSTVTDLKTRKKLNANSIKQNRVPAKGHEIPLASFIKNKSLADIHMDDGQDYNGVMIRGFDNWTITIDLQGEPYTIFKHSIRGFCAAQDDADV